MSSQFTQGQSLVEVLLALSVFILGVVTIGLLVIDADFASRQGVERSKAVFLAEEALEAARSIRDSGFQNLTVGDHGVVLSGGTWGFSGTSDTQEQYTRVLTLSDISPVLKKAVARVEWQFSTARTSVVSFVTYFSNFVRRLWTQTSRADFFTGSRNSVQVTETFDGEVSLLALGDFQNSSIVTTFNVAGNGDTTELAIHDDVLYVSTLRTNGPEFSAFDISDVSNGNIIEHGTFEANTDIYGFGFYNEYAFLVTADNGGEVVALRLSDMTQVSSYDIPTDSDALSIYISNNVAYVGTQDSAAEEFYVLDISDPLSGMTLLSSVEIGSSVNAIAVSSGYAFLATDADNREIVVVRLSDESIVNSLNLGDVANATDITIEGQTAYITRLTSSDNELYAIDVSTPETTLSILRSRDLGTHAYACFVATNGRIYVSTASDSQELMVFDASTFTPSGSGDSPGNGDARALYFFGAHAYVGTDENSSEVSVFQGNSGGWSNPTLVGSYDTAGVPDANEVFIVGTDAYVVTNVNAGANPELYILDISTPTTPSLLGSLDVNTGIHDVRVSGNYAYLATPDNTREFLVVDVSNKFAPTLAGSYNTSGNEDALSIYSVGTTIYLGMARGGGARRELYVINASNPAAPTLLGSYEVNADVYDIIVSGNFAYLSTADNGGELLILNISNPASITQVGVYNMPGNDDARGLFLLSNTLYVTRDDGGGNHDFFIFDVSNPSVPTLLSSLDLQSDNRGVFVSGTNAYIATELSVQGLLVLDITLLSSPVIRGTFNTGAGATGVSGTGGYAVLSTRSDTSEFQIVGQGGVTSELARDGRFQSSAFDAGIPAVWGDISWSESGIGGLSFKLRTADTESNLPSARWVGPDGTTGTFYTATGTPIVTDPSATGTQWIQYKAYFVGDGTQTKILQDIALSY